MTEIALVGLGAWGLCVLERLVDACRRSPSCRVRVHVVEPGAPGSGVYSTDQPDYLILNVACGQMSLYPYPDRPDTPDYGVGFYEWARARNYRWEGDSCRCGGAGRKITPHDYLPRRMLGEYLEWFYTALVAASPRGLEIRHHKCAAIDVEPVEGGRERVLLGDGGSIRVDYVVITSGHTDNLEGAEGDASVPSQPAYPVEAYARSTSAGESLGVAGMGLVALDVVAAVTTGRGGRFVERGDRMRYVPSGSEPVVELFSRSGLPYGAKAVSGSDPTGEYEPRVCTPQVVAGLRSRRDAGEQLDFRRDLLPVILAEMQVRYYSRAALLAEGPVAAGDAEEDLARGWERGTLDRELARFAGRFGAFDPAAHFFGNLADGFASSKDYETWVYATIEEDLAEALKPAGSSPVKAAHEVLRVLRDPMRDVLEFGGLTLESYREFQSSIRSKVLRLVAGPPAVRSQQLLALMDAGVVRVPFGPSPRVEPSSRAWAVVRSTRLDVPYASEVDRMVRAHLDDPDLGRSASALLANLSARGRLVPLRYGEAEVGSVALSRDAHPLGRDGQPQERLWAFGPLTEGTRYFTHYIPSPRSRIRMFLDAEVCVAQMLG